MSACTLVWTTDPDTGGAIRGQIVGAPEPAAVSLVALIIGAALVRRRLAS
jgi:hypothetical protein